jgi:hypothetical protein
VGKILEHPLCTITILILHDAVHVPQPNVPDLVPDVHHSPVGQNRIRTDSIRSGTTRLTSAGRSTSSLPASNPSSVAVVAAVRRELVSEEEIWVVLGFGGDGGVAREEEALGGSPWLRRERRTTMGLRRLPPGPLRRRGAEGGGELGCLAVEGCEDGVVAADVLLAEVLVVGEPSVWWRRTDGWRFF